MPNNWLRIRSIKFKKNKFSSSNSRKPKKSRKRLKR